jgi:D-hydroxyproline dehydrogenase
VGAGDLLQDRGALYLYDTAADYAAAHKDMAARRAMGVTVDLVGPADLAALEPGLSQGAAGGAFFPKARFLTDPGQIMAHLARAAGQAGVQHLRWRVLSLGRSHGAIRVAGEGHSLQAQQVVIAAGAHSRPLAAMAGDRVPLDTERGYHVEYDMAVPRLLRPTCPTAQGFYLCPMAGRLRVAGTVELGGLDPRPSQHRIDRLVKGAQTMFPDLPAPSRTWLGFRPSLPDSLPVIGPSSAGPQVLYAFGHGHIGVTLAPVTAAIIADLVAGRIPPVDLAATSVRRFRSG